MLQSRWFYGWLFLEGLAVPKTGFEIAQKIRLISRDFYLAFVVKGRQPQLQIKSDLSICKPVSAPFDFQTNYLFREVLLCILKYHYSKSGLALFQQPPSNALQMSCIAQVLVPDYCSDKRCLKKLFFRCSAVVAYTTESGHLSIYIDNWDAFSNTQSRE